MFIEKELINCQKGCSYPSIDRKFWSIKCTIKKGTDSYNNILSEAKGLATDTVDAAASDSAIDRKKNRKLVDSFCGLISEKGWEEFLNYIFGQVASPTDFDKASNQIDIKLNDEKLIEVRSSNVRNGTKFGICSREYNFKNIGPYKNNVKPGEIQKHYYCGVLIPHRKREILNLDSLPYHLVGSSTWEMMMNGENGYFTHLSASDANLLEPGEYRVLEYRHTMDTVEFAKHLIANEGLTISNKINGQVEIT